jgi:hypothetical protein
MTLINIGKEYSDEVRTDISLGKVKPQIGTKLTYKDDTLPQGLHGGTWLNDDNYEVVVSGITYQFHDWVRVS